MNFLRSQFGVGSGTSAGGARRDRFLEVIVILFAVGLAAFSVREYIAPDYIAEYLPSLNALKTDGFQGFLDHLPGYPGAMMAQLPFVLISNALGLSDAATWRILSEVAVAVLAIAVVTAIPLIRATEASRGSARLAVTLAVACPGAYWALRIGHPEEILATGLLLGSAIAAARERPILAGLLLGLAIGKAWPVVAALPVLGLLLPNGRRVLIAAIASAITLAVIYLPSMLFASTSVVLLTNLGSSHIFNTGQIWWWVGSPIDMANIALQVVPQPRVSPAWTGEISHPLIVGVGFAVGLVWCWTVWQRLTAPGSRSIAALLRSDGRTRTPEQAAQLAGSALLVMAGVLYARCYLDTWNVPYYLLPGLVCGAIGEVLLGRRPIITLVATGLMWKYHAPGDLTIRTDPDLYTAMYLAWTIPFSIALMTLGFRAAMALNAPVTLESARDQPEAATAPGGPKAGAGAASDGGTPASAP